MGKAKYDPQAAILGDPMEQLRARAQETIARQSPLINPQISQSGTGDQVAVAMNPKVDLGALAGEHTSAEPQPGEGGTSELQVPIQRAAFVPPALAVAPDKPKKRKGKPQGFTFWLYPEDTAKIRQLSAFLSSAYEMRTNDSLIVRAALRCISANDNLHEAVCEALQSDRRRRKVSGSTASDV